MIRTAGGQRTLLVALFLVLYVLPLGHRPLFMPDEFRYAEIPREMLVSGDWVVPRLNNLRYFEKPVGGYWLVAASMSLFGENAFAVRLPAALSAGLAALLVYWLARRLTDEPLAGALAAGILLLTPEFFGVGCANTLDMPFAMFLTAGMAFFLFGYLSRRSRFRTLLLTLSGAAFGMGFLIKGFLAFAVAGLAIPPFVFWQEARGGLGAAVRAGPREVLRTAGRSALALLRLSLLPLAGALTTALPWSIAIALREGDFWNRFFWYEHVHRFLSGDSQHPEPFYFFALLLPAVALPWFFMLPAAIRGIGKEGLKAPLVRFAICWFLFPFLLLSASRGKLLTYILPCFPPLALLLACGLPRYFAGARTRLFSAGTGVAAAVFAVAGVGLPVYQSVGARSAPFLPGERWEWILTAFAFLAAAFLLVLATRGGPWRRRVALCMAATASFLFVTHFVLPGRAAGNDRTPGRFLRKHVVKAGRDEPLLADMDVLHAVCWETKRADVYVLGTRSELQYGLGFGQDDIRRVRFRELEAFARSVPKGSTFTLVLSRRSFEKERYRIPPPVRVVEKGRQVVVQCPGSGPAPGATAAGEGENAGGGRALRSGPSDHQEGAE